MKIEFRNSFLKDLKKIKDKKLLNELKEVIEKIEAASNLLKVENIKQLTAEGKYSRIRIADYRIGLKKEEEVIVFVRFLLERIFTNIFLHKKQLNCSVPVNYIFV